MFSPSLSNLSYASLLMLALIPYFCTQICLPITRSTKILVLRPVLIIYISNMAGPKLTRRRVLKHSSFICIIEFFDLRFSFAITFTFFR